ncbi:MAG: hypothetical protein IJ292_05360 [Clostridia bacterium]|nr:hypothetical protein [Clostridia bacterium]
MRTKTKALALALCAVLLVVSTVFVTMAFLTGSDSVQNTFTFGQVGISLDEAEVDASGKVKNGENRKSTDGRVEGNEYHLIPSHNYVKDPTIHVDDDSENCLLFVKLENALEPIVAGKNTFSAEDPADTVYTIEAQMMKNGWTLIDSANNIWAYNKVVAENEHINVFDEFTLTDNADVSKYATVKDDQGNVKGGKTIKVTAYAVQADGFVEDTTVSPDDAKNAWGETKDSFEN